MIYSRKDGSYIFELNGGMCGTVEGDEFWEDIVDRITNGEEVSQYVPPSSNESWVWDSENEEWRPDFEEQKTNILSSITTERNKRILSGFTYSEKQIACDNVSQNNANAFLTANSLGLVTFPIQWRTIDNTYISIVDSTELITFASTMLGFVQLQFQESWEVKDNIENSVDIDTVNIFYEGYING